MVCFFIQILKFGGVMMDDKIKMRFDFYYGKEAEQFNFYRIPKLLFTDNRFSKVSIEAKVLYGLLLDRMSLSIKNGWVDEENRVYIYFKVSDAMEYMNICKEKCIKLFAELDSEKGCGLIFRKRQGLGKPSIIYVMNFNSGSYEDESQIEEGEVDTFQRSEKQTSGGLESTDFKKSEKQTSVRSEIPTSESSGVRLQEVGDADSNENKINNNKNNYNYFSDTHPIKSYPGSTAPKNSDVIDEMRERERYKELICLNIEYPALVQNYSKDAADGIVDIMVDAVCSKRDYLVVSCDEIPQAAVKSRMLKLDYSHVEYVLDCLKNNTTKVRNIKSYLLTALYNSYSTMDHFYTAEVNHDMYGTI